MVAATTSTEPLAGGVESPATRRPSAASRLDVARAVSVFSRTTARHVLRAVTAFWRDSKPALAAAAKNHQIRLVVHQLSHVLAENAWPVISGRATARTGRPYRSVRPRQEASSKNDDASTTHRVSLSSRLAPPGMEPAILRATDATRRMNCGEAWIGTE